MTLWRRIDSKAKDVVESERLCKKRDALEKKAPEVEAAYRKVDEERVLPAAAAAACAGYTQNPERVLEAREVLKQAIWSRDGIKAAYQRELAELNAEVEMLNGPTIAERVTQWQAALAELRTKKAIEVDRRYRDMSSEKLPSMVKVSSNFAILAMAKEGLLGAIKTLRCMSMRPLSEVNAFIEATETKMRALDLGEMKSEEAMTETRLSELISSPDVQILDQGLQSRLVHRL